jgi:hypothetical protein
LLFVARAFYENRLSPEGHISIYQENQYHQCAKHFTPAAFANWTCDLVMAARLADHEEPFSISTAGAKP